MWEYNKLVYIYDTNADLVVKLNELGLNNWEIISVNDAEQKKYGKKLVSTILMKRKTTETKQIL